MSFFPPGHTSIYDGHFTNAQTVYQSYHTAPSVPNITPFMILKDHAARDASFDSAARFDPPKCHPETRTALLDYIDRWANDLQAQAILWIKGGAGAGKSAIAQTLSERWDEEDLLAASFYFSRTAPGRNEKNRLISTLAYQLSISIPAIRPLIEAVIDKDPEILDRNLKTQMKKLIVNPIQSVAKNTDVTRRLIVIDGLDECCTTYTNQNHEQQQKEILESLKFAFGHAGFPLRFLVTSRPERQIREIFDHGLLAPISSCVTLDNSHNPSADIELYLRCKLEEIKKAHSYLSRSWPSEDIIAQLVVKSSGHFIYVAVVVRYLITPRINPEDALKAILQVNSEQSTVNPFAELDALYSHILSSVLAESIPNVMQILAFLTAPDRDGIMWVDQHGNSQTVNSSAPFFIAKFLFIPVSQLYLDLTDLHSIMTVPLTDDIGTPITFLHASFSEFLSNPARSGKFYVDRSYWDPYELSLAVKHLFLQVLSHNAGTSDHYTEYTFSVFIGFILDKDNATWKTEDLDGIRALVNTDENEFKKYVYHLKLQDWGICRRSMGVIQSLYTNNHDGEWHAQKTNVPLVLRILKRYPKEGFNPIKPTSFFPERCWEEDFDAEWNAITECSPNNTDDDAIGERHSTIVNRGDQSEGNSRRVSNSTEEADLEYSEDEALTNSVFLALRGRRKRGR